MQNIIKKYWDISLIFIIILLGVYLRFKSYWANPSFFFDEAGLAYNIKNRSFLELFDVLNFTQMAPPFFLILTKFLVNFLGHSEKIFRFIPFLIGCFSITAFYFLSKEIINNKIVTAISVYLFAINKALIDYSTEFKPYIIDVFATIICLLFFIKFNLEKSSKKRILFFGFCLAAVPWFSFASIFIITGGMINLLIKNFRDNFQKVILMATPFFISGIVYLKIFILNNYVHSYMIYYWTKVVKGFLSVNAYALTLLRFNTEFLFSFPSYSWFYISVIAALFTYGIFVLYKKQKTLFNIFVISLILLLISSLLHIYPFWRRLILFLLPITLLAITKPLDTVSLKNKWGSAFIIILFFVIFIQQSLTVTRWLKTGNFTKHNNYSRQIVHIIFSNIKPNDKIILDRASAPEFFYYSPYSNNVIISYLRTPNQFNFFENLKKGRYWIFLNYDDEKSHNQLIDKICLWTKKQKVLKYNGYIPSIVYYVEVK